MKIEPYITPMEKAVVQMGAKPSAILITKAAANLNAFPMAVGNGDIIPTFYHKGFRRGGSLTANSLAKKLKDHLTFEVGEFRVSILGTEFFDPRDWGATDISPGVFEYVRKKKRPRFIYVPDDMVPASRKIKIKGYHPGMPVSERAIWDFFAALNYHIFGSLILGSVIFADNSPGHHFEKSGGTLVISDLATYYGIRELPEIPDLNGKPAWIRVNFNASPKTNEAWYLDMYSP